jgi:hypothetical protein
MSGSKRKKAKAQPPKIVSMSATGGTLMLPDTEEDQDVEIQYGARAHFSTRGRLSRGATCAALLTEHANLCRYNS